MRLQNVFQHIALATAITIAAAGADDGKEFNIVPESPVDSEFFDNSVPASYLSEKKDRNIQNYAILESGPTDQLQKDEIYIEPLDIAYSLEETYPKRSTAKAGTDEDIYPAAAGVFINDEDTAVPENLVSIEALNTKKNAVATSPIEPNKTGEFVNNEEGGITAPLAPEDRYTAFPAGTFSIGYQMRYLHYSENNSSCETIYNGIQATFNYRFADTLNFRASSNILGGAIFNRNNGSIYSETKFTLGNEFNSGKFTLKPYLGIGLRYMNNIFAGNNATSRNTLQLYIPVGMELAYQPREDFRLCTTLEAAPIALNQNWTTFSDSSEDSTATGFNGINVLLELGTEFRLNEALFLNITPYYQYTYTGSKESSPIGSSNTHMVGINASIKF